VTATLPKTLIDIPKDKGIHIKTAGKKAEKYVYKYTKHYRNQNGQPRSKAKNIGKYDPKTNKMQPNNNYYQLYPTQQTQPKPTTIYDYGYTYLIQKISQQIGLTDTLTQTFGEKQAQEILTIVAYMIKEGTTMDTIDDWQQRNHTNLTRTLTSAACSTLFANQTPAQRHEFFKHWIKKSLTNSTVYYDVTPISYYSQNLMSVEHYYNNYHENLNQFNLGMFCDEQTKLPLYYNRYNGNLTDKTNLSYVLANAKNIGIERVKLVLDERFWSEEDLKTLRSCCAAFTLRMPPSLKLSQQLLVTHRSEVESYTHELELYPHLYGISVDTVVCGVEGRVLLFYDALSHVKLCEDLSAYIEDLKVELAGLKHYPTKNLSRYEPYFVLTRHVGDLEFDYAVDTQKVELLRAMKGYFLLFSTDMLSSLSDVLYYYRAKDVDEGLFTQIGVDLSCGRVCVHSEEIIEGKVFVVFVACVLRSYLLSRLAGFLSVNCLSLRKALNLLSNIVIMSCGGDEFRFVWALSEKQKKILSVFGVEDDIVGSLEGL
jgi:transposase